MSQRAVPQRLSSVDYLGADTVMNILHSPQHHCLAQSQDLAQRPPHTQLPPVRCLRPPCQGVGP